MTGIPTKTGRPPRVDRELPDNCIACYEIRSVVSCYTRIEFFKHPFVLNITDDRLVFRRAIISDRKQRLANALNGCFYFSINANLGSRNLLLDSDESDSGTLVFYFQPETSD